jgi:hypothetical protein
MCYENGCKNAEREILPREQSEFGTAPWFGGVILIASNLLRPKSSNLQQRPAMSLRWEYNRQAREIHEKESAPIRLRNLMMVARARKVESRAKEVPSGRPKIRAKESSDCRPGLPNHQPQPLPSWSAVRPAGSARQTMKGGGYLLLLRYPGRRSAWAIIFRPYGANGTYLRPSSRKREIVRRTLRFGRS